MNITETVDKYLMNEDSSEQAKKDWNKVIDVIHSIDDMKQVRTAQNMIINYKKVHGDDQSHKMLELELKMVSRRLRVNPTGH